MQTLIKMNSLERELSVKCTHLYPSLLLRGNYNGELGEVGASGGQARGPVRIDKLNTASAGKRGKMGRPWALLPKIPQTFQRGLFSGNFLVV